MRKRLKWPPTPISLRDKRKTKRDKIETKRDNERIDETKREMMRQ